MSLFGKILAVFNVLAVVGVLVVVGMAYGKRTRWQYEIFLQEVERDGLPLDGKELDERQQPLADRITPDVQKDLFKGVAPATPVATQEAEVNRVKNELQGKVSAVGDKKKQLYLYARILTPMALTAAQREEFLAYQIHLRDDKTFAALQKRLLDAHKAAVKKPEEGRARPYDEAFHQALSEQYADPPGPLADEFLTVMKPNPAADPNQGLDKALDNQLARLQGQFEQTFRDALAGGVAAKSGAIPERKKSIARLLLNMTDVLPDEAGADKKPDLTGNPAYKRFVVVVGLRAAAGAAADEGEIVKDLAVEVEVDRARQRGLFAVEHEKAVELAREKVVELEAHSLLLARKKKELGRHEDALRRRREDVKGYQEQLATLRGDTTQHLQQLRTMSNALFAERVKLRDNTADNQRLEKQIRDLEFGRQ